MKLKLKTTHFHMMKVQPRSHMENAVIGMLFYLIMGTWIAVLPSRKANKNIFSINKTISTICATPTHHGMCNFMWKHWTNVSQESQRKYLKYLTADNFLMFKSTVSNFTYKWTCYIQAINKSLYFRVYRVFFQMVSRWHSHTGQMNVYCTCSTNTTSTQKTSAGQVAKFHLTVC